MTNCIDQHNSATLVMTCKRKDVEMGLLCVYAIPIPSFNAFWHKQHRAKLRIALGASWANSIKLTPNTVHTTLNIIKAVNNP